MLRHGGTVYRKRFFPTSSRETTLNPPDPFAAWHDFALLLGTASATLIGLLFVAASVGASVFTLERQAPLRVFLSPSVVHFCSVLAASLIAVAPVGDWHLLGALITGTGIFGAIYAALVCRTLVRSHLVSTLDLSDRVWYAAIPAVGYAVMLAAGAMLIRGLDSGCDLLAASMGLLLAAGIRNAWDITTWIIMRTK